MNWVKHNHRKHGFTFIELLVVIVIIAILAAIALPRFMGIQDNARIAAVKANMRTIQVAAEAYSGDNGGTYPMSKPTGNDAFSSYFPGGSAGGVTMGSPPVNPFTNVASFDDIVSIKVDDIFAERAKTPNNAAICGNLPGQIGYCGVGATKDSANAASYAIEGVDATKNAIAGATTEKTLVLSNQTE